MNPPTVEVRSAIGSAACTPFVISNIPSERSSFALREVRARCEGRAGARETLFLSLAVSMSHDAFRMLTEVGQQGVDGFEIYFNFFVRGRQRPMGGCFIQYTHDDAL